MVSEPLLSREPEETGSRAQTEGRAEEHGELGVGETSKGNRASDCAPGREHTGQVACPANSCDVSEFKPSSASPCLGHLGQAV